VVTSWHSRTSPFLFSVLPLRLLHRLPCSKLRRCRELPTRRFTPRSMRYSTVLILWSARTPCPAVRAPQYSCRRFVGSTLVAGPVLASSKCTQTDCWLCYVPSWLRTSQLLSLTTSVSHALRRHCLPPANLPSKTRWLPRATPSCILLFCSVAPLSSASEAVVQHLEEGGAVA
jgi:hypothetical protein